MKVNSKSILTSSIDILVAEIRDSKSIEGVWEKVKLLSRTFKRDLIEIFILVCQKLDNVFITCHFVECLCDMTDTICDKNQIDYILELAVLLISQQITYFENNAFNLNAMPYDPLTFPLAFELLKKCLVHYGSPRHPVIIELINCIEIVRQYYPFDVIEKTTRERKINASIFPETSRISNGHLKGARESGNKRDSLSIFETVVEPVGFAAINVVNSHQFDESLKPIIECVSHAFKLVSFVINSASCPYNLFIKYLQADENEQ